MFRTYRPRSLLLLGACVLAWATPVYCDLAGPEAPSSSAGGAEPRSHKKTVYYDADRNTYFLPASVRYRLVLEGEGVGQTLLQDGHSRDSFPMQMPEGSHALKAAAAGNAEYNIISDGTPPLTVHRFSKTPQKQVDGEVFFGRGLTLTIESKDDISGLAQVFMSLNGGAFNPINNGSTVKFDQDGQYHVMYYAVDRVGNAEPVKQVRFSVDTHNPLTNILKNGKRYFLVSKDTGVGKTTSYFKFDSGQWETYAGGIALEVLKDGPHQIAYYSVDGVENKEEEKTLNFVYDSTPPQIETEWKGRQYIGSDLTYIRKDTVLLVHAKDNISAMPRTFVRFGKGAEMDMSTVTHAVGFSDLTGMQNFTVRAVDEAGNESSKLLKVSVDTVPPHVELNYRGGVVWKGAQPWIHPGSEVVISATDRQSGIAKVRICEGKNCVDGAQPYPLTVPGEHQLRISAEDRVGNVTELPEAHVYVLNEKLDPSRSLASTNGGPPASKQFVSDESYGTIGPAQIKYSIFISDSPGLGGHVFKLVTSGDFPPFTEEGVQEISASIGARRIKVKVPVDVVPPQTLLTLSGAKAYYRAKDAPKDGKDKDSDKITGHDEEKMIYYGPGLTAQLVARDLPAKNNSGVDSIQYSVDRDAFQTYNQPLALFTEERPYTLRYYSLDRVGNVERMHETSFVEDITPPKTALQWVGKTFSDVINASTQIKLTAEDQTSGVSWTNFAFDDEKLKTGSNFDPEGLNAKLKALKDGVHKIHFLSEDHVQNREPAQDLSFRKDTTPPTVEVKFLEDAFLQKQGKAKQQFIGKHAVMRIHATDDISGVSQVWWKRKSDAQSEVKKEYLSDVTLDGEKADFEIQVQAQDQVENSTPWVPYPVRVDTTPPETQMTVQGVHYQLASTLFVKNSTKILLQAKDNLAGIQAIHYRIDDGTVHTYTDHVELPHLAQFELYYWSTDQVNNTELVQLSRIVIDNTPPKVEVKPANGAPIETNHEAVLARGNYLYISAVDLQSGTKDIHYRVNQGPEKLYQGPILLSNAGKYEVEVDATDWLHNTTVKKVRYVVK